MMTGAVVTDNLVEKVNAKFMKIKDYQFLSFQLHFIRFHTHFIPKIVNCIVSTVTERNFILVTGNETWIFCPNVELKKSSTQWHHSSPAKAKKIKQILSI